ncbi:hypothetical protein BDZ89DRAFT_835043 [Hymenopellis radicata]|nr:hypothetical protein BDZ89DRAFT_835043 [Hymenopellis radicata]
MKLDLSDFLKKDAGRCKLDASRLPAAANPFPYLVHFQYRLKIYCVGSLASFSPNSQLGLVVVSIGYF